MREIKAPDKFNLVTNRYAIFLAGSIEMGTAEPWQERVVAQFQDTDITFLNPRRADWDSSWVQEASNPQFAQQVNWELDALNYSDLIVFYFDPNTKSPITLMELGLFADSPQEVIVCCPPGFWRKGNVDIVCNRFGIELVENFDDLISAVKFATRFWQKRS
jgi:hypothetical protein